MIFDDDDSSMESAPIDIFAQGDLSPEAGPITEHVSPQPVIAPIEQPQTEADIAEAAEVVNEITDELLNRSEDVEGEFISLELEGDVNRLVATMEGLCLIHDRIVSTGGICKDDVYQIECLAPGIIKNGTELNRFSSYPSTTGLTTSVEDLAEDIIKAIKRILEYIVARLRKFGKRISERFARSKLTNPKREYEELLATARKLDGRGIMSRIRADKPNDPLVAKSANVQHYVKLLTQDKLASQQNRWIKAYTSIRMGGTIQSELASLRAITERSVKVLSKNADSLKRGESSMVPLPPFIYPEGEIRAKYEPIFGQRARLPIGEFLSFVDYNYDVYSSCVTAMVSASSDFDRIADTIDKLIVGIKQTDRLRIREAGQTLNTQSISVGKQLAMFNYLADYYDAYNKLLSTICNIVKVQLVPYGSLLR